MADTNETPGEQEPKSSKTPILLGIIIIVLVAGYAIAKKGNKEEPTDTTNDQTQNTVIEPSMQTPTPTPTPEGTASSTPTPAPTPESTTKEFLVKAQNFSFSPSEMKVKKGDKVKITFENTGGFHDWTIDEFNAHTPTVPAGQTVSLEFVADKAGTFEYYCSVGSHRQMGMKGNLIVE